MRNNNELPSSDSFLSWVEPLLPSLHVIRSFFHEVQRHSSQWISLVSQVLKTAPKFAIASGIYDGFPYNAPDGMLISDEILLFKGTVVEVDNS